MSEPDRRRLLAARREQLVLQAAMQRQQLGLAVAPMAHAWRWAERGLMAWALLRRRPWLLAVPVALLVWRRPQGVLRALATASTLWRAGRSAQQWLGR